MKTYKVTFVADYFVLHTTVQLPHEGFSEYEIIMEANKIIKDTYAFEPEKVAYDVDIEEVEY